MFSNLSFKRTLLGTHNAAPQPLPEAEARHERTLEAVGCRRLFGREAHLPWPYSQPCAALWSPAPGVHTTAGSAFESDPGFMSPFLVGMGGLASTSSACHRFCF